MSQTGVNTLKIIDCNNLELQPLEYTDHNYYDMEDELDPDNNFFATINNNCRYYTAVYVTNKLNYKVVESMTTAIDNLVECITIEINYH